MSDSTETVKIKPSHESQGAYVLINKSDFDESKHELYEATEMGKPSDGLSVEQLKTALADQKIAIPDGITKKADLAALLDVAST
jgi:hypothetical protein